MNFREFKPRVSRVYLSRDCWSWMIVFPNAGAPTTWFASDCAYIRRSIAAWYRDGVDGLLVLHERRMRELKAKIRAF